MNIKYSIIIPTLNEELFIEKVLKSFDKIDRCEIIISDGGSTDKTIEIAKMHSVKVVESKPGRGIQLNNGAKASSGEILCFLHADTILSTNAFILLDEYFKNSEKKICRFKLGFDLNHWLLDRYKTFSKYDSLFTRFGDMFIAVRKDFYDELGGYPNWKSFEDVEYLRKASKISKVKVLNAKVCSSARTFTKYGLIRQQIYNGYLMSKYLLGFRKFIEENHYYNRTQKIKRASIILFVKYPVEGKVKTRLAKTVGNTIATKLYRLFAESIFSFTSDINTSYKYIFFSEKNEESLIRKWIGKKYFYVSQDGDDLGERMKNAFRLVFSHGAKKTIIIGTDIPDLSKEIIEESIDKLDKSDLVIGPSPDGGYYLLGIKKYQPFLFDGITYSTNTVLQETIKKAKDNGLTYHTLDLLADIDNEEELKNWLDKGNNKMLIKEISKIYN